MLPTARPACPQAAQCLSPASTVIVIIIIMKCVMLRGSPRAETMKKGLSVLFCSIYTITRCFIGIVGPRNQPLSQAQKQAPLISTYNPKNSWDRKAELSVSE